MKEPVHIDCGNRRWRCGIKSGGRTDQRSDTTGAGGGDADTEFLRNLLFRNKIWLFVATLSMLAQHNLSRTLAEPTLVAMSGESASFLAGGEIPTFEKSNGLNDTTIEFKPFGVELTFNPTVLSDDTVQLKTNVSLTCGADPSFLARTALRRHRETFAFKRRSGQKLTVRLKMVRVLPSLVLLKDELSKVSAEVPGLASIPIIGLSIQEQELRATGDGIGGCRYSPTRRSTRAESASNLPGHDGPTGSNGSTDVSPQLG